MMKHFIEMTVRDSQGFTTENPLITVVEHLGEVCVFIGRQHDVELAMSHKSAAMLSNMLKQCTEKDKNEE